MNKWPYEVVPYTPEEVDVYVKDPHWAMFEDRLKDYPTARKLDNLFVYYDQCLTHNPKGGDQRRWQVQTSYYINVLKHSGQLNANLEVQR